MGRIYLIGLPGSGKSTLGLLLAKEVGWRFLDLDDGLQRKTGLSIPDLFKTHGEDAFRDMERDYLLSQASEEGDWVIATGGGVVLRDINRATMRSTGIVIFIDRSPELIMEDIDVTHRPLLMQNPKRLWDLEKERRELYLKCCHSHLSLGGNVQESLELLHSTVLIAAMQCDEHGD